ncbi:MAG: TIGR04086 family membrane protein [Clostridia bacterium]|nr:TIGR04086 family membrane protein [Clostridia bacterium]
MRSQDIFPGYRASSRGSTPITRGLGKGLLVAVGITLGGIVVFALLMQAIRPTDEMVSAFNQVLKLAAILLGVGTSVGRGGVHGASRGALLGLLYMALGVGLYALLSDQSLSWVAYAADIGMGIATGGLGGMVFSNLPIK